MMVVLSRETMLHLSNFRLTTSGRLLGQCGRNAG